MELRDDPRNAIASVRGLCAGRELPPQSAVGVPVTACAARNVSPDRVGWGRSAAHALRRGCVVALLVLFVLGSALIAGSALTVARSTGLQQLAGWAASRTSGSLPRGPGAQPVSAEVTRAYRWADAGRALPNLASIRGEDFRSDTWFDANSTDPALRADVLIAPLFLGLCAAVGAGLVHRNRPRPFLASPRRTRTAVVGIALRALPLACVLLVVSHFISAYWYAAAASGASVDAGATALATPLLAAAVACLLLVVSIARGRVAALLGPSACFVMSPRCVHCGYHAAPERPCPECGLDNPLALRRVYFGRWHARLMLSRWRWLAALPWALVAVLFFWPLISGLARHWLF